MIIAETVLSALDFLLKESLRTLLQGLHFYRNLDSASLLLIHPFQQCLYVPTLLHDIIKGRLNRITQFHRLSPAYIVHRPFV